MQLFINPLNVHLPEKATSDVMKINFDLVDQVIWPALSIIQEAVCL